MIIRLDLAEQVAEIYRDGKLVTVRDIAPFMERKSMTLPPAITRPGEMWSVGGPHLTQVVVSRPNEVQIAEFLTVRDAACAVQAHNMIEELVALYRNWPDPDDMAFPAPIEAILAKYGRG